MRSVSYPITIHVSVGARPSPDTPDMVSVKTREITRVLLSERSTSEGRRARSETRTGANETHDLIPTRRDIFNHVMRVARPLRRRAHACGELP